MNCVLPENTALRLGRTSQADCVNRGKINSWVVLGLHSVNKGEVDWLNGLNGLEQCRLWGI